MKGFLGTLLTLFILWFLLSGNAEKVYHAVEERGLKSVIMQVWEGR